MWGDLITSEVCHSLSPLCLQGKARPSSLSPESQQLHNLGISSVLTWLLRDQSAIIIYYFSSSVLIRQSGLKCYFYQVTQLLSLLSFPIYISASRKYETYRFSNSIEQLPMPLFIMTTRSFQKATEEANLEENEINSDYCSHWGRDWPDWSVYWDHWGYLDMERSLASQEG